MAGHARGKPSTIETRLFINGEFKPSLSGKTFDVINPTTEQIAATVFEALPEDVDSAVAAAKTAFPAWSGLEATERATYLLKLADGIEKSLDEIGYLEAITMGKPYLDPPYECKWNSSDDAKASAGLRIVGVGRHTVEVIRHSASLAMDIIGETSLNSKGFINFSLRQPFGVGAAIVPWNGPTFMLANKIGPGLIAGNTMIVKSSEKSPLSALVIARIANEIGLPAGVLNVLSGFGFPCGDAMARHMDIRVISFTGSVPTGKAIKKASAESNLKKVTLELGGKNPMLIFDDADLQQAIPAAAVSVVANSGQGCILTSRIYVQQSIAEKFIEGVKNTMIKIAGTVDDPTEKTTRGPQADKLQFDRIMNYFQYAKDQNFELRHGGGRARSKGYFIEPTIYTNVPENARIMTEEIFGPVVCINTFVDEDEVIKRANDTEFGLYANVFTRDISRALRVAKQLEAGSISVNVGATTKLDMPMGGWKQSGDGREFSKHAWEGWTEQKSVYVKL